MFASDQHLRRRQILFRALWRGGSELALRGPLLFLPWPCPFSAGAAFGHTKPASLAIDFTPLVTVVFARCGIDVARMPASATHASHISQPQTPPAPPGIGARVADPCPPRSPLPSEGFLAI